MSYSLGWQLDEKKKTQYPNQSGDGWALPGYFSQLTPLPPRLQYMWCPHNLRGYGTRDRDFEKRQQLVKLIPVFASIHFESSLFLVVSAPSGEYAVSVF